MRAPEALPVAPLCGSHTGVIHMLDTRHIRSTLVAAAVQLGLAVITVAKICSFPYLPYKIVTVRRDLNEYSSIVFVLLLDGKVVPDTLIGRLLRSNHGLQDTSHYSIDCHSVSVGKVFQHVAVSCLLF